MRAPIDGYDWDIQDAPVELYSREFVEGALQRALAWKRSQDPDWYESLDLQSQPFNQPKEVGQGWVQVGYLRSDRWRLKVYWRPTDDRVQVEREPGRPVDIPSPAAPKPVNPTPWSFQVKLTEEYVGEEHRVQARVHPFPSTEHPDPGGPAMVFVMPDPPDLDQNWWRFTVSHISCQFLKVELGDEIKTAAPDERRRLFTEAIWDIARRSAEPSRR